MARRPLLSLFFGVMGGGGNEPSNAPSQSSMMDAGVPTPVVVPVPAPVPVFNPAIDAVPTPHTPGFFGNFESDSGSSAPNDVDQQMLKSLPTQSPTHTLTQEPSRKAVTAEPTSVPSREPAAEPTQTPTREPTAKPTRQPSHVPTAEPTPGTSSQPTATPISTPSHQPTAQPTLATTRAPTPEPTITPTRTRTSRPTLQPTQLMSNARENTKKPSGRPTPTPTAKPSRKPTGRPTPNPTVKPTRGATGSPTNGPTIESTRSPTKTPTTATAGLVISRAVNPTRKPTQAPQAAAITSIQVVSKDDITYIPGRLVRNESGLLLSRGLRAKVIARSGKKVQYQNGKQSNRAFHGRPDAGQTFPDNRNENKGGWIYVSNSEMRMQDTGGLKGQGGVGAITFNKQGNIIDYKMILTNTTWNCGGGMTPWGSWVSCEEQPGGSIYQVDPYGIRKGEKMTLGKEGGAWESFAYDMRNMQTPRFYHTEDHPRGAVQRFTPNTVDWKKDPWKMLHGDGMTEYLKLIPNAERTGGKYRWITARVTARNNAFQHYPNVEGIDCDGESVFFVSKSFRMLYELNLADGTYTNSSTVRGKFDGTPDQVARILANGNNVKHKDDLLYFTEESGRNAGVHGRNAGGKYVTIFESPVYKGECAGLAFSPDGMHVYVAYQDEGVLLDIWREDGFPFHAKVLNIKYHTPPPSSDNDNGGDGGNDNSGGGGGVVDNANNNNGNNEVTVSRQMNQ